MRESDDRPASVSLNRSVQRAALVLKMLATDRQGMTLNQLTKSTKLAESTVYRLLLTLEQQGMVERASDGSGRFLMGLEMFRLGSAVLERLGIGQNVLTFLEQLAEDTGETVNLGALHGFNVLYLQKVESQQTLRASLTVGSSSVPAHCSANGKMLLAQLDDHHLQALLDAHPLMTQGPNSITDRDTLVNELRHIRERGYAVDDLEFAADIRAVAAPILNHFGQTIAAVSVAGPATRMSLEQTHLLSSNVIEIAHRISTKLGYQK